VNTGSRITGSILKLYISIKKKKIKKMHMFLTNKPGETFLWNKLY